MDQSTDLFTAIAIEDEKDVLADLEDTIKLIPGLRLLESFTNPLEAIEYVNKIKRVHLIFCDIEMPIINGWTLFKTLSNCCDRFIFTTGHPQHTLESYRQGVDAYLLKPVAREQIERIVNKLAESKKQILIKANKGIFIKDGSKILFFHLDDIISLRSLENYITVETTTGTELIRMTMQEAQKRFEATGRFIRIHQRTIVSKEKISKLQFGVVYLSNGSQYPISKSYLSHFEKYWRDHLM